MLKLVAVSQIDFRQVVPFKIKVKRMQVVAGQKINYLLVIDRSDLQGG